MKHARLGTPEGVVEELAAAVDDVGADLSPEKRERLACAMGAAIARLLQPEPRTLVRRVVREHPLPDLTHEETCALVAILEGRFQREWFVHQATNNPTAIAVRLEGLGLIRRMGSRMGHLHYGLTARGARVADDAAKGG